MPYTSEEIERLVLAARHRIPSVKGEYENVFQQICRALVEVYSSQAAGGAKEAARDVLEQHWPKKHGWRVTAEMVKQSAAIIQKAIDAALQAKPESGWRGIESAPKDGTIVQLFFRNQFGEDVRHHGKWDGKQWNDPWNDDDTGTDIPATHWQPLSASPAHKATPTDNPKA